MLEKSQEYLRLAMAAAALLIGLSVAYHYVFYIPQKDEARQVAETTKAQKIARDAEAKAKASEKLAQERRANYRICLSAAQFEYHSRWDTSCKRLSEAADRDRAKCVAGGINQEWCQSTYPSRPAADCSLPTSLSNDYDKSLEDEKKRCLDEARAGVLTSELGE